MRTPVKIRKPIIDHDERAPYSVYNQDKSLFFTVPQREVAHFFRETSEDTVFAEYEEVDGKHHFYLLNRRLDW